jgi:predicted TIM-barrel fold metal-dependent hydrolase
MSAIGSGDTASGRIRARLDHPVIDADGHLIETAPVFKHFLVDYAKQIGGGDIAARFEKAGGIDYDETVLRPWSALSDEQRRAMWTTRPPWWTFPASNTLDRATGQLPRLMYERLDDFGIDFAVLYPSRTLTTTAIRDDEVRQVACRALNAFNADVYGEYGDRMTTVAHIPMHTPDEAIAELDHAVGELGFKAILINGLVHRPVGAPADEKPGIPNWGSGSAERIDTLGVDSAYDYDPVWKRCLELKVAPASHAPGMGWGSRRSVSSYMYNHMGSFAAAMDALCKSLFLGGVTRRFPGLSFALLEGGVGWACILFADIVSHWEKRNAKSIQDLDPARIDTELLMKLFAEYGDARFTADLDRVKESVTRLEPEPPYTDEWAACRIDRVEDIHDLFVPRFYFGCEADDPSVAWAFDTRANPLGAKLRAMFSSDMGHWDVPDMSDVLAEAHELVEKGLIDEAAFRDFVFVNPARFYTSANPDFFVGTRCEQAAAKLLAEAGGEA